MKATHVLLLTAFEKFIRRSVSGSRRLPSGKKLSNGSIIQYKAVYRLLQEFELETGFTVSVTMLRRFSLAHLRKEKIYWNRFFNRFTSFLYRRNCFDDYVAGVSKVIRTFFHYLQVELGLPVSPFYKRFRVPVFPHYPVVLSPEQLRYLITDAGFRNSLPAHLQRTMDIFIIGCTTGLRYSDLMQVRKNSLLYLKDGVWMVVHTRKTGVELRLPLPDYAVAIIKRWQRHTGVFVLPRLSATNLNIQICEIMLRAGWDFVFPKIRHRRGKAVEIKRVDGGSYRFCDHISIHSARRTAITTLLLLGVEENIVRRISGHAPGSREFYKYVGLVQDYLQLQVRAAHRNLIAG